MTDVSFERPRFLTESDCHDLAKRLEGVTSGGGYTVVQIASAWTGVVRWARNQISTASDVRDNAISITRNIRGAMGTVSINETTDASLVAAARQAERIARLHPERPQSDLATRLPLEPQERPELFSEATYQLDADRRSVAATALARTATAAGMLSAGDIVVTARSLATLDTEGRKLYFQYTAAEYHVTVRDPRGVGSGWAGIDHHDWNMIDAAKLTATALDKCLRSRNPVRVEPGRYTTILEPQAVGDFMHGLFTNGLWGERQPMNLNTNLAPGTGGIGPFNKVLKPIPYTNLGERVIDERLSISADPRDPELGFPPYSAVPGNGVDQFTVPVYHKVTWIDHGVLTRLAYTREDGINMGQALGLPNSGAFRVSAEGKTSTIEEMIGTTKRGIVVTRFDSPTLLDLRSQLYRGYTRDGLWLVEDGRISKPIKNLAFTESILFALNNVEQIGTPQRVFCGSMTMPFNVPQPRIVPALKIRDFSFTALTDAV
jgi:predicted Zn-dependent protease